MDAVYNITLVVGIALTSPLFITIGTMLAIPAGILVDWIVKKEMLTPLQIAGTVLIVVSFLGLNCLEKADAGKAAASSGKGGRMSGHEGGVLLLDDEGVDSALLLDEDHCAPARRSSSV